MAAFITKRKKNNTSTNTNANANKNTIIVNVNSIESNNFLKSFNQNHHPAIDETNNKQESTEVEKQHQPEREIKRESKKRRNKRIFHIYLGQ